MLAIQHTHLFICPDFCFISEIVDVPTPYLIANTLPLTPLFNFCKISCFSASVKVLCALFGAMMFFNLIENLDLDSSFAAF